MKRIGVLIAAACLCTPILAVQPYPAAAQSDDPLSIVREIYLQYGENGELFDVPERYFSIGLLELWRDVEKGAHERDVEGALGFTVFRDSGDDDAIEIDDVRLQLMAEKYVIATYVVMVEEAEAIAAIKKYFQYNFENTADGWKIDNIDWGPDRQTLRNYLTELKALQGMRDKPNASP
jgi:hypothetical protein